MTKNRRIFFGTAIVSLLGLLGWTLAAHGDRTTASTPRTSRNAASTATSDSTSNRPFGWRPMSVEGGPSAPVAFLGSSPRYLLTRTEGRLVRYDLDAERWLATSDLGRLPLEGAATAWLEGAAEL